MDQNFVKIYNNLFLMRILNILYTYIFLISKISYHVLIFYILQQTLSPYALQPHYPSHSMTYKGSGSESFQHLLHQHRNKDNNECY